MSNMKPVEAGSRLPLCGVAVDGAGTLGLGLFIKVFLIGWIGLKHQGGTNYRS